MKVEVEIPEGEYCNEHGADCPFLDTESVWCNYLKEGVGYDGGYLKHPDCPSLKEKEDAKIKENK